MHMEGTGMRRSARAQALPESPPAATYRLVRSRCGAAPGHPAGGVPRLVQELGGGRCRRAAAGGRRLHGQLHHHAAAGVLPLKGPCCVCWHAALGPVVARRTAMPRRQSRCLLLACSARSRPQQQHLRLPSLAVLLPAMCSRGTSARPPAPLAPTPTSAGRPTATRRAWCCRPGSTAGRSSSAASSSSGTTA